MFQIYDLGRPFKAHDVRKLNQCSACGGIGFLPQMLTLGQKKQHFHGACVVQMMTHEEILALPTAERKKLRLNETGKDLMLKLLDCED